MPLNKELYYYLWIAPHVLQIVLAVLMMRQRLVREFPLFFTYTIFEIFQFFVLFVFMHLNFMRVYAVLYYGGETVSAALRFAIIYEILSKVLRDYSPLRRIRHSLFHWATAVLTILAVLIVAYTPSMQTDTAVIVQNVLDRTISIIQCGLLLLLLGLSRFLKLSWKSFAFGIALGLGIYDGLKLLDWGLADRFGGLETSDWYTMIVMAAYHCSVLFWVVTLLLAQAQRVRAPEVSPSTLEQWDNTLERFLQS
jgi:hypothetical protein